MQFQKTRAEFEGDITLVVFPFVKAARKAPAMVAQEVGEALVGGLIEKYNAVQGFLNLCIAQSYWIEQLQAIAENTEYGQLSRGEGEKNLEEGKKSYALSFILQDSENTLKDKQIEAIMAKLLKTFEEKFGAKLR